VLKRSGTRRPCFGLWDRLFWILLSWRWPRWPESLTIIQPETVKRWRRNGWSGLWRYRSSGRWRGGRPRVSREVRELITRMARDNFVWGAPRIHGELLMLGYKVSQATVSRYLSTLHRRPGQSWRTLVSNQVLAFKHRNDDLDDADTDHFPLQDHSSHGQLVRFASRIVRPDATARHRQAHRTPPLPMRRTTLVHEGRARDAQLRSFRFQAAPDGSLTARANPLPTAVKMRGPPVLYGARARAVRRGVARIKF